MNFIKVKNQKDEEQLFEIDPAKVKIIQGKLYDKKTLKFVKV
jgi:hypothetical protein